METLVNVLKRPYIKRLLALIFVGLAILLIKKQITLFLLTFVFIFLVNAAQKSINKHIGRFVKINNKLFVILLYLLFVGVFFFSVYKFLPEMIREITEIIKSVTTYITNYDLFTKSDNVVINSIYNYFEEIDIQQYIQNIGTMILNFVSSIGAISINAMLAILLSLFFLLEQDKIAKFYSEFKNSKLSWLYNELNYFGEKFSNSFGKVVQTQLLISFINSILSVTFFVILGFPNTFGLFIMVFALGLIPIAGVIISLVPLCVIAYTIGGIRYIMLIVAMILVLHSLEAYILNPKLMAHKTKLPVFVTFLILILSEHFLGVWGLIIGIPLTMFLLDVLEVKTVESTSDNQR